MAKANIVTLFKLLHKYDGEKSMTLGHWRIGRGAYDLEFEIYAKVNGHEETFASKYVGESFEECGCLTCERLCGFDFDVVAPMLRKAYNSRYDFNGVYDWKKLWASFITEYRTRQQELLEKYK